MSARGGMGIGEADEVVLLLPLVAVAIAVAPSSPPRLAIFALLRIELASTTSLRDIFVLTTSTSRETVVESTVGPSIVLFKCSSMPVGSTEEKEMSGGEGKIDLEMRGDVVDQCSTESYSGEIIQFKGAKQSKGIRNRSIHQPIYLSSNSHS